MKNTYRILALILSIVLIHSCSRDKVPSLTTIAVSGITASTAASGGSIISEGGDAITARGVCWGISPNPSIDGSHTTDGKGSGSFTSYIGCLSFATTYYVRAYATNSVGTDYGEQKSFTTQGTNPIIFNPDLTYGSVSDIDGNCYKTIQIGTQTWMAENLSSTMFNNGSEIPLVVGMEAWSELGTPGYCWYNNDTAAYKAAYGALYNWYVINLGSNGGQNVCPTGWHVPTDSEWTTLLTYLGGTGAAGFGLKETGTVHWQGNNSEATNESGFTALPGGYRRIVSPDLPELSDFYGLGISGQWWSDGTRPSVGKINESSFSQQILDGGEFPKHFGISVRCVKDN